MLLYLLEKFIALLYTFGAIVGWTQVQHYLKKLCIPFVPLKICVFFCILQTKTWIFSGTEGEYGYVIKIKFFP